MRASKEIKAEIEKRFGFFPPFFVPAMETPEILENLWQQTLSAYVNNPLPDLFKEKLFAYLSRYCSVPYCIICHSCALRPLGLSVKSIFELLKEPFSIQGIGTEECFSILAAESAPLATWPEPDSPLERVLIRCSVCIFLNHNHTEHCLKVMYHLLNPKLYNHLNAFLSYVKACHLWVESHPELAYEADQRFKDHYKPLVEQEPLLAEFFKNYREEIAIESKKLKDRQADEIVKLNQAKDVLQKSKQLLERTFASLHDALFIIDADTVEIMDCNRAAEEIFGYSRQELVGQTTSFLHIDEASLEEFRRHLYTAIEKNGDLREFEFRMKRKDGTIFNTDHSVVPIINEKGKRYAWVSIVRDITERKQVEEALESEKQRVFTILDLVPGFVYLQAPDYTIPFANRRFIEHYGDPKGRRCHEIIWDRKEPCDKCPTFDVFKTKRPAVWVSDHRSSGSVYQVYDYPFIDSDGSLLVLEMCIEITEQKKAEEALKESERNLAKAQEITHIGHWKLNPETNEVKGSDELYRIFGLSREESTFESFVEAVHPEDREFDVATIRRGIDHGENWNIEHRLICRDGTQKWIQAIGEPITDETGKTVSLVGTCQDITERKQVEETIKQYADVVKNMQVGLYIYHLEDIDDDRTLRMVGTNPAASLYTGVAMEDVLGKTLVENFPGLREKDIPQIYAEVVRTGISKVLEDVYYGDDRVIEGAFSVKAFPLPNNCVGVAFENITERKRAEEALFRKSEELALMNKELHKLAMEMTRVEEKERKKLAEVLHENIGQNLVAIKIAFQSGNDVSELVPLINATIQSTRSLTTDLYPPVLDKNNLINALEWYVRSVLKSKDIKVSLDIDPAVDELNDDFKKDIYRIIRECFQNIVKHSSASSVKVKIKKVKDCFQIKVKDNGVGFSIKGSKVKSGEGIGLKLMREWVKSLNGRFNIKSQPGKGTEITIELPDEKSKEQKGKTRKKN